MGWTKPKKPFHATVPLKTDLEGDDKSSLCDLAKFWRLYNVHLYNMTIDQWFS